MPLTKITQYMNDEKKKLKDSKNAMTKQGKIGGGWGWRRDCRAPGKDLVQCVGGFGVIEG